MAPVSGAGFGSTVKLGLAGGELETGRPDPQGHPGTTTLLTLVGFKAPLHTSNLIKTPLRNHKNPG